MMEFLIIIGVILSIAYGIYNGFNVTSSPTIIPRAKNNLQIKKRVVKPKPKPKPKQDPNKTEAKNTLVSFGYTATEAKKLLQGMNCNTVEQYVSKAMEKVKI